MKIAKNTVVSLTYDLRLKNFENEIFESATVENPLTFLYGTGAMLPFFEQNLENMEVGNEFKFQLTPEQAYGPKIDENLVDIPRNVFEEKGQDSPLLVLGNTISLQDNNGNVYDAVVHEIKDEIVIMDFNHPLAGEDLFFMGKIIEVREATSQEMEHGHVHDPNHHHHHEMEGEE